MRNAEPRLAAWGLAVAACAWAVLLPLAAAAGGPAAAGQSSARRPLAVVYSIGHVICHQRVERSFRWSGVPWPVCARCTGLYAGAAVGALAALAGLFGGRATGRAGSRALPPAEIRRWLVLALLPTAVSLAAEWASGVMPSHGIRAACGASAGSVTALLLSRFLQEHEVN